MRQSTHCYHTVAEDAESSESGEEAEEDDEEVSHQQAGTHIHVRCINRRILS